MSIIGRKAKSATSGVAYEVLGLVDRGVVVLDDGRINIKAWGDLILLPEDKPDVPRPRKTGLIPPPPPPVRKI